MFDHLRAFIRHGKQANDWKDKPVDFATLSVSDELTVHSDSNFGSVLPSDLDDTTSSDTPSLEKILPEVQKEPYEQVGPQDYSYGGANYEAAQQIADQERQQRKQRKQEYPNLDDYEVLERMGEGAFSVVHKARHIPTGNMVAIKILRKYQMDNVQRQAVLKEAIIMRQLNHPNVVKFGELIESEPYYYIVQELVVGGEIFTAIVNYTYLSEDLARHVVYQVALAVKYLHEEVGIVHRDIKPENLLFVPIDHKPSLNPIAKLRRSDDPKTKQDEGEFLPGVGGGTIGTVKLADFGLSKQIWEQNTKTPCGTVGYTAPEIVRDERYSKEVDMWAIGCVLYTFLCGFPPFYDERIEALTEKVARGEYTFLSPWWDEISDEAKYCVKRLLTVDPKQRYTIDDFFQDPWVRKAVPPVSTDPKKQQPRYSRKFYQNKDLYSPAATAMREAFDISAAVHRMGEEAAFKNRDVIAEEDEDMDDSLISGGDAIPRQLKNDINPQELFDLNLGGASILERRKNKTLAVRT